MSNKRTRRWVAALVLMALTVTACSGAGPSPAASSPGETPAGGTPAGSTPASEPVTLTFWADPSFGPGARGLDIETVGDYEQQLIDAFREDHPNVTIELEINNYEDHTPKITTALAAGAPPDIYRAGGAGRKFGFNELAPEFVWDLRELLPAEVLAGFDDQYLDLTTAPDGKLFAIETHGVPIHMGANRNLFDQAGVEYPDALWTRDDFEAACDAIVPDFAPYCVGHQFNQPDPYATVTKFWAGGGGLYDDDGTCALDSPANVETVEWMLSLEERGWFLPGAAVLGYDDPVTALLDGTTAIIFSHHLGTRARTNEAIDAGRAIEGFDWEPLLNPAKQGVDNAGIWSSTNGFQALKVDDDPNRQQALADFLSFLISAERTAEQGYAFGGIPFRTDGPPPPDEDPEFDLVNSWVTEFGINNDWATHPFRRTTNLPNLNETFTPEMQAIWLREKTPEEGLGAMQQACEAAVAAAQ